jgi:hypothetical protein
MTGVALLDRSFDQASAPESCGESRLPATSVAQKSCHHELFGLGHANPTVTLRIYAHLFRKRDDKSAAAINAALAGFGVS